MISLFMWRINLFFILLALFGTIMCWSRMCLCAFHPAAKRIINQIAFPRATYMTIQLTETITHTSYHHLACLYWFSHTNAAPMCTLSAGMIKWNLSHLTSLMQRLVWKKLCEYSMHRSDVCPCDGPATLWVNLQDMLHSRSAGSSETCWNILCTQLFA